EIKKRLGSSDVVLVSTIHDRLWDIIRLYQIELVQLHLGKMKKEAEKISDDLLDKNSKIFCKYANLSDKQKNEFNVFAMRHRDVYTLNRDAKPDDFRAAYRGIENKPSFFDDLISNVQNFKNVVRHLYKLDRYQR